MAGPKAQARPAGRAWPRKRAKGQALALPALAGASLLLLLAAGPAQAACGDAVPVAGRQRIESPGLTLVFAPRPAPVPLGRPFGLAIQLCPGEGQPLPDRLVVDAEMPAHRHGMNYRPTVAAQGDGRFLAEGLMFHMPGHWRLWFDIPQGAGQPPRRLSADLRL